MAGEWVPDALPEPDAADGPNSDAAAVDATGKYVEPGDVACDRELAHGVAPRTACDDTACRADGRAGNLSFRATDARAVKPGTAPTFLLDAASSTRAHIPAADVVCFFAVFASPIWRPPGKGEAERELLADDEAKFDTGCVGTREGK